MRPDRSKLLETSPLKSDGGELVGRDPRTLSRDELAQFEGLAPIKAIRARCLDCCGGDASEVRKCVSVDCPTWPYRMGVNPFHGQRQSEKAAAGVQPARPTSEVE